MIGCLKARHRLYVASLREWNHLTTSRSPFSWSWDLEDACVLVRFFWPFFLLLVILRGFFIATLSSSDLLLWPFTVSVLLESEGSCKTFIPLEVSSTKEQDNNCMVGRAENKRKLVAICKLFSAYPPNKLPHIPPKAIANQDTDCRSPANEALINNKRRTWVEFGFNEH